MREVTDWITDGPADGDDDTEGHRREDALEALMVLMEDTDFQESLFNTGEHVTDEDDVTWHNVSAGHLNPELADGFADIVISFQDAFANTDGLPGNTPLGYGQGPEFDPEVRVAFTQLAVGDPDAAEKLYTEVLLNSAESMEEYSSNTGKRDPDISIQSSSFQTLVEVALLNESSARGANDQEFADYRNKVSGSVINALGGFGGDRGASGLSVELVKIIATEVFEVTESDSGARVEVRGSWVESERMMGYALGAAAERDPDLMAELEEEGIAQRDGSGILYVPPDHSTWGVSGSDAEIQKYYGQIDDLPWPDGESSTREAVENFVRAFQLTEEKWNDHLNSKGGGE